MAKKRATTQAVRQSSASATESTADSLHTATVAMERAREALRCAEAAYQRVTRQERDSSPTSDAVTSENVTVGDLVESTAEFVRRHPNAGLLAAGMVGFLLGRLTRP